MSSRDLNLNWKEADEIWETFPEDIEAGAELWDELHTEVVPYNPDREIERKREWLDG